MQGNRLKGKNLDVYVCAVCCKGLKTSTLYQKSHLSSVIEPSEIPSEQSLIDMEEDDNEAEIIVHHVRVFLTF